MQSILASLDSRNQVSFFCSQNKSQNPTCRHIEEEELKVVSPKILQVAHGPAMVGAPPAGNLAQQPDNPQGEIPGMEAANEAGEHGMDMEPEIQEVGEEEVEPEIPGVGEEEDEADDDESTQYEAAVE